MDIIVPKETYPICCESCKSNKSGIEFRKLVTLTGSGLNVYINTSGKKEANRKHSVILHNIGNNVLKKPDFFGELCNRKTKCYLCDKLIQKICNLINEVTEIKEKETVAVCEHCKRCNTNKCKKCEAMVKKFLNYQINQYETRQQALKIRLYEVRRILSIIVDRKNICDHKICQAYYDSNAELKILLELIKSPMPTKQPDEEYFYIMEPRKESERENMDKDLFLKCSLLPDSKESMDTITSESSESFCICKYLRNRSMGSTQSFTFPPSTLDPLAKVIAPTESRPHEKSKLSVLKDKNTYAEKTSIEKSLDKQPSAEDPLIKKTSAKKTSAEKRFAKKTSAEKSPDKQPSAEKTFDKKTSAKKAPNKNEKAKDKEEKKKKSSSKKQTSLDDDKENTPINKEKGKTSTEDKAISSKQNEEIKMMMKLIKNKDKDKNRQERSARKDQTPTLTTIKDLPETTHVKKKVETESQTSSQSTLVCPHDESLSPPELVLGNRIVPFFKSHLLVDDKEPLIFKIEHNFLPLEKTLTNTVTTTTVTATSDKSREKRIAQQSVNTIRPGFIIYELSNKKFIEKGWTQLPETKILRRMNIYKMLPACPQFDWFANHKNQMLFYNTGEILAQVNPDGCGRWFYKSGRVALEYYNTKDIKSGLKYVVYDIDDPAEGKKNKSKRILASFDHLGNGIVYDNIGNVRLKYNQSEGLVIDKKLGPPGKWKWHTLNEPPVLQHVYVETLEESDPCFKTGVVKQNIYDPDVVKRKVSENVIAIEFENFVKEKATKLLQRFKPFEIRIKTVKINDYFSVRIINQGNIQLLFRCNQVSLKVNMGLLLVSNVIVDTVMSEVGDVFTPFDGPISRSTSLMSIPASIVSAYY